MFNDCLQNQLAGVNNAKNDILKGLALYYNTFVDVMEFKVRHFKYCSIYVVNYELPMHQWDICRIC